MILSREAIQRMVGDRVGGSGAGGAGISGNQMEQMLAGYARQEWVDNNYVSIEFFGRLFQAYNGNTVVNPNDTTTTIDNIKAMFGFWTEQYISALSQGSGGGGGGQGDVTWALLADNSDNRQIASSHITDLLGGTFSGKNYAVQRDANGKLYVNVPWTDTTYSFSNADATLAWSTRTKIATVGGTDIYVTMPANPNTDHYDWSDITNKPATATRWPAFSEVTGSASASQLPNIENLTNFSSRVYDATVNRTANTVLAGPTNGNATPATFRSLVAADIPSLAISKISGLQTALDSKLDIAFFGRLFQAYNGTTAVNPNDTTTTIDNIKAMFGFWTEQYISALGQGSGGGGGGQGDVTWALLADNSDNRQIASSHITDLLGGTFSGKNYAVQRDANGKLYVNVPWVNTTYGADNGVGLSGTTFYNSGVRATTINGNYLRVNTNGTNTDLTIPYATNAGTALVGNKLNVIATISGQDTANYPWRLLASRAEITTNYADTEAVIILRQFAVGGRTGTIKIAFRTNLIATTASGVNAVWLDRFGFDVDDVKIAVYWEANKSYADVFVKATAWNRMEMHVIGNRDWTFHSSSEGVGGSSPVNAYASIEAAATALHGRAYTNIVSAQDGGIVSYANSAGAATNDSDGNAINNTYLKKSGGTMTGELTLNNAVYLYGKNTGGTSYILAGLNGNNIFVLGYGTAGAGYNTILDGNNVYLRYGTSHTTGFCLDSSGNVGIGTTSPTNKLQVVGNTYITGSFLADEGIRSVKHLTAGYDLPHQSANRAEIAVISITDLPCDLMLGSNSAKKWSITCRESSDSYKLGVYSYSSSAMAVYFNGTTIEPQGNIENTYYKLNASSSNPYLKLVETSPNARTWYVQGYQGYLYLGSVSAKSLRVDNNGGLSVPDNITANGDIILANNKSISMKDSDGEVNNVLYLSSSNQLILGSETANEGYNTYLRGGAVYLQYGGANTGLLLNNSGNVGIGTTSPSYKLHVSGDVYATGGVTSLSDIRKKNVIDYELPLTIEQIADAPTIRFTWKDGHEDSEQVGTVAQYWQKVLPQVTRDKNDELSMQYGVAALVATITTARKVVDHEKLLQEQARKIEEQAKEIRELREKLYKLKIA